MNSFIKSGIFLLTLGLTACDDYLDVNTDPNNPSTASLQLVLPAAQASTASVVGGDLQGLGGLWAQYYTQSPEAGQYRNIDSYNLTTDFFDGCWLELYAGGLNDYREVIEQALEQGEYNYYLIARLMRIYTFQVLADLHDQIPYSAALDPANVQPAYDEGRAVYQALLGELDEAVNAYLENVENSDANPRNADLIYGGDMAQWLRFANSLKFKMLMRASYTDLADSKAILDLIAEDMFITESAAMTAFSDATGQRNFFYEIDFEFLGGVNFVASNTLLSYLEANDDPRLEALFNPNDAGEYAGVEQGDFNDDPRSLSELSVPAINPTMPAYLMTTAEIHFLIAEALIRFSNGEGACEAYEAGIRASFELLGLPVGEAEELYGAGGPYACELTGNAEEDLRQVMLQKWVALANIHNIEAFFELNRTGYPAYTDLYTDDPAYQPGSLVYSITSVLPAGQAPRRLFFPDISVSRNQNAPAQPGSIAQGVWWDQN